MEKEFYLKKANKYFKFKRLTKETFITQINKFYELNQSFKLPKHGYKVGDLVFLKKGTFLHGSRDAMNMLDEIKKDGIISKDFVKDYNKNVKTPLCASMWNIQEDISLKDYIILYSGATVTLSTADNKMVDIKLVKYGELDKELEKFRDTPYWRWVAEQTKESRFMPCLANNKVDIAFIFNMQSEKAKDYIKNDVFNLELSPKVVKTVLEKWFYEKYIYCEKRTPLTTDRESAILFGVPSCFIEGILVGREFEKNDEGIKKLKESFPNCYICNLDGVVIKE